MPETSVDWQRVLDVAAARGAVAPGPLASIRQRVRDASRGDLSPALVASWLGVTPEAMRDLLAQATETPTVVPERLKPLAALLLGEERGEEPTVLRPQAGLQSDSFATVHRDAERPPAPQPPRRIGPYDIMGELGHGGMGVVYRARDARLGREVALKVLVAGAHAPEELLVRFQREAALAAKMGKHPHIVQVHDIGRDGPMHYFTMDLVEGTTLRGWLGKERAPREVMAMLHKVALALAHAHAHGVVHRDLKPDNILVDASGEPQVTDFGLARELDSSVRLSVTGQVMGTPAYMAPEQADGRPSDIGPATDVYALGAVLYEALAGRPPFEGSLLPALIAQVLTKDPLPLRRLCPRVAAEIETIAMKCLEKDPARRYRDGGDLAAEIARYVAGEPILARPSGPASRIWKRVRRNPVVSLLAAALVLATVVAGLAQWRAESGRRDAERERNGLVARLTQQLADTGDAYVAATLALRAKGDLRNAVRYSDALSAPIAQLKEITPDRAEPWFYEGRMQRALGNDANAEHAQDKAVALADSSAIGGDIRVWTHYERGILRAERLHRLREDRRTEMLQERARRLAPGAPPPSVPTTAEVEAASPELRDLKRQAIEDLKAVEAYGGSDDRLRARARAARGIETVLTGGNADDARGILRSALADDSCMEEVYEALAAIEEERGAWREAAEVYEEGHKADRGYIPHLRGLAAALTNMESGPLAEGEWVRCEDRALGAILEGIAMDSRDVGLRVRLVLVCCGLGDLQRRHGESPVETYRRALDVAAQTLAIDPSSADAHFAAASAHLCRAEWRESQDEDPSEEICIAGAEYEKALAARPAFAYAAYNLAMAHDDLADWLGKHGKDTDEEDRAAEAAYDRALSIDPRYANALNNLAVLHRRLGDRLARRGEDPMAEYEKALAGLDARMAVPPDTCEASFNEGNLFIAIGRWKADHGADPAPWCEKARAAYERATRTDPACCEAHAGEGVALHMLGRFDESIAALETALRLRPGDPGALDALMDAQYDAACHLALASVGRQHAADPAKAVDPTEARRLRDEAFTHLGKLTDLGYADRGHVEGEAELAPLHDDPRWKALLERLRK